MMKLDILGTRDSGRIMDALYATYGFSDELYGVFLRKREEKLYLVSPDFQRIDDNMLRIDTMGLYFGTYDGREIRLTIEGSQIIGPGSTKNVIDLTKDQASRWLKGEEILLDSEIKGFAIIRSGEDYMGTGRMKEGRLMNFIPKTRRVGATF
jgi:NOL1/NOP2/fmu family ribosome biogenesis protein